MKNTDTGLSGLNSWVWLMIIPPNGTGPPDLKSLDLHPLFPRAVVVVETDMLITMGIH
jgi:hypothetical protein